MNRNGKQGNNRKTSIKLKVWSLKPIKLISSQSDYEERSYKLPESRMRGVALLQIWQILKWIIRKYYEQLHANKLKNLDENGQIPGEKLPNVTKEKIDNLKSSTVSNWEENSKPDDFTSEFYQRFRKK